MSDWKEGKVKWFRPDGTGYIISSDLFETSILIDRSAFSLCDEEIFEVIKKDANVVYKSKIVMGKEIATDVQPL